MDSSLVQCVVFYALSKENNTKPFVDKYFRSSECKIERGAKCICLPGAFNEDLVKKLGPSILTHVTVEDKSIHDDICKQCKLSRIIFNITTAQCLL